MTYRFFSTIQLITILFCFALMMCIVGCSQKKTHNTKIVFRYNESAGITSLDPAFASRTENIWALNQLYNGLVQLNEKLEIKPSIAHSWEIANNGKTFIFHLRNDVYFHKNKIAFGDKLNRKVTAKDFEYSFSRIINNKTASPGKWVFANVDSIKPFETPNDSTFIIHLQKTFIPFLNLLSNAYCAVIPHEAIEKFGVDFRSNPVGTGPFYFKSWDEGEKLVLLKNGAYFEMENGKRLPFIDAVAISFIKDKQTAYLEFLKGNFDFMSGLDGSYKDDILDKQGRLNAKYSKAFAMHKMPFLKTDYLGIVVEKSNDNPQNILLNKKVRQAINYAIDRKKIIKFLRNNIGTPALGGFVPNGMPGFEAMPVAGYEYNPAKAKLIIDEINLGSKKITITTTATYVDVCEYIQKQLAAIGLNLTIDVVLPAINTELTANAKAPMFRKSWVADYADAENYLQPFYSKNFSPNGPNYTHFSNKLFDATYNNAVAELDDAKRIKLYIFLDSLVMSEAPVIPLYYDDAVVFYAKGWKNFHFNSMHLLQLKYLVFNK